MKLIDRQPLTEQTITPTPDRQNLELKTLAPSDPAAEHQNADAIDAPMPGTVPPRKPHLHRPSNKQLVIGAIAIGLASVVGILGLNWWQFASTHQETDDATVTGDIHPISTRINGNVAQVLVQDNQLVKAGQTLVKLDPRDYQAKVDRAAAALATAKRQASVIQSNIQLATQTAQASDTQAQGGASNSNAALSSAISAVAESRSGIPTANAAVDRAKSEINAAIAAVKEAQAAIPAAEAAVAEARSGVPAAQAQVAQIDATLIRSQADYRRYQQLRETGATSQQQLDTVSASYQESLAKRTAAVQGVQQAKSRVAQAQETVVQARAQLAQAQAGIATANSQLAQAQAGVVRAKAQVAQAEDGVNRAKAQIVTARGASQQAKAVGFQTQVSKSQYQAALATVAQAQTDLKEAQLQLSYTNLVAPSNGRIGNKRVQIGQQAQSGTPLMAIVDNNYWVVANFKETQLNQMHSGQKVEVKIDSFAKHPFVGQLESLSPASGAKFSLLPPDNATGNFTKIVQRIPVKIVFDPQSIKGYETKITPGMSATVTVDIDK
jgi:membrane fusion protein, multidrug efflux system